MQELLILFAIAMAGQVTHWIVGANSRLLLVSYNKYMLTHKWHTFRALLSICASVIGLCGSTDCELTRQTVSLVFMCGYTFDSLFNKFPRGTDQ